MCHDASCGVNGNADDIPTSQFDLAGMQTGAQRQADLLVTDLVAGTGLKFAERGSHELKGLPGRWDLFAASL